MIALRWPTACLSCGVDVHQALDPRHGIIGLFHVDKKVTRGDRRHTQVLVKLPGFFFMCDECTSVISTAAKNPPKNHEKLVETLQESPWMEFIEVEKSGHVRLPDGLSDYLRYSPLVHRTNARQIEFCMMFLALSHVFNGIRDSF